MRAIPAPSKAMRDAARRRREGSLKADIYHFPRISFRCCTAITVPAGGDYTKVAVSFIFLSQCGKEGGAGMIEKRSLPRRGLLKK
jgi:hypothetical protein